MVAEIRAIIPKRKGLGLANHKAAIELGMDRFMGILEDDLNKVVGTWKKKPTFRIVRKRERGHFVIGIFTDDQRWKWIGEGTSPYIIRPKKAKALAFRSGYTPATAPNRFIARQAGRSGAFVLTKEVHHPGIKPRKFNEKLVKRNRPKFNQFMRDTVRSSDG